MTQPEALRLAELLEYPSVFHGYKAAAELRRLHAVNQELTNKLEMAEACAAADGALITGLKIEKKELLEALKEMLPGAEAMGWDTDKARAAIARAEGGQE